MHARQSPHPTGSGSHRPHHGGDTCVKVTPPPALAPRPALLAQKPISFGTFYATIEYKDAQQSGSPGRSKLVRGPGLRFTERRSTTRRFKGVFFPPRRRSELRTGNVLCANEPQNKEHFISPLPLHGRGYAGQRVLLTLGNITSIIIRILLYQKKNPFNPNLSVLYSKHSSLIK